MKNLKIKVNLTLFNIKIFDERIIIKRSVEKKEDKETIYDNFYYLKYIKYKENKIILFSIDSKFIIIDSSSTIKLVELDVSSFELLLDSMFIEDTLLLVYKQNKYITDKNNLFYRVFQIDELLNSLKFLYLIDTNLTSTLNFKFYTKNLIDKYISSFIYKNENFVFVYLFYLKKSDLNKNRINLLVDIVTFFLPKVKEKVYGKCTHILSQNINYLKLISLKSTNRKSIFLINRISKNLLYIILIEKLNLKLVVLENNIIKSRYKIEGIEDLIDIKYNNKIKLLLIVCKKKYYTKEYNIYIDILNRKILEINTVSNTHKYSIK